MSNRKGVQDALSLIEERIIALQEEHDNRPPKSEISLAADRAAIDELHVVHHYLRASLSPGRARGEHLYLAAQRIIRWSNDHMLPSKKYGRDYFVKRARGTVDFPVDSASTPPEGAK